MTEPAPEPDDDAGALGVAVRVGEGLRAGAWWALGAGAGVVPPLAIAAIVNARLDDKVWPTHSPEGYAVEALGAGVVGFVAGSAPVRPGTHEAPGALMVACLAAPWPTALLQAVVGAAIVGVEPVRGLETALRELRGPTDPGHFALLYAGSVALGAARFAWLRVGDLRLSLLAGAAPPLLIATAVLVGCVAARSAILGPVMAFLAVGGVTVPGGALLAEGRLRPRLRTLLVRDDAEGG